MVEFLRKYLQLPDILDSNDGRISEEISTIRTAMTVEFLRKYQPLLENLDSNMMVEFLRKYLQLLEKLDSNDGRISTETSTIARHFGEE